MVRAGWQSNRKTQTLVKHGASYVLLLIGGVLFLLPFFWQITTSLKTSADTVLYPPVLVSNPLQWQNYATLFERFPFGQYIVNSSLVTSLVIIGTVMSNSLAAYGFARLRMPGRDLIFILLLSTLMLPGIVLIIPQFVLYSRLQWINTYYPLILPAFFGNAFYLFLMRQFLLTLPHELEDAAKMDGAGYLRTYAQIILPQALPVILAVVLYAFVATWNDFLSPLIYLSEKELYTLPVALRYLAGGIRNRPEYHLLMAASTLSILPCIVLFVIAQRWFIQGTVVSGVKG